MKGAHARQASVERYLQLRLDGISSDLSSREFDRRLRALMEAMRTGLADILQDGDALAAGPAPRTPRRSSSRASPESGWERRSPIRPSQPT
jgi:hypothetical protein